MGDNQLTTIQNCVVNQKVSWDADSVEVVGTIAEGLRTTAEGLLELAVLFKGVSIEFGPGIQVSADTKKEEKEQREITNMMRDNIEDEDTEAYDAKPDCIAPEYVGVKIVQAVPQSRASEEGYRIIYEDGYVSWSPKHVFDKAYRPINGMTFGLAIEAIKKGHRVIRRGWNGKGIFIALQTPDANSANTLPYIYIDTRQLITSNPDAPKGRVPWLASQTDMLAEDYEILEG